MLHTLNALTCKLDPARRRLLWRRSLNQYLQHMLVTNELGFSVVFFCRFFCRFFCQFFCRFVRMFFLGSGRRRDLRGRAYSPLVFKCSKLAISFLSQSLECPSAFFNAIAVFICSRYSLSYSNNKELIFESDDKVFLEQY
jgi:hypothetical protein